MPGAGEKDGPEAQPPGFPKEARGGIRVAFGGNVATVFGTPVQKQLLLLGLFQNVQEFSPCHLSGLIQPQLVGQIL